MIDDFSGSVETIAGIADSLAPFGKASNFYPGLRRILTKQDTAAFAYVDRACREATKFVAGAFGAVGFNLIEASFSMVTTRPSDLVVPQRAPHFDSVHDNYVALLHYLRVPEGTGTAFFRQRSTGIEFVTPDNADRFVEAAKDEVPTLPDDVGYIYGSNRFFEQIGAVEAVPDRLLIYQGSLLHSGIIPSDMAFSDDPRTGRLTANFFIQVQRNPSDA